MKILTEENTTKKTKYKSEGDFVKHIINFLEMHYKDPNLQVNSICEALSLSRTHLHRKSKEYFGKSVIEIVTAFRLEKAKIVLTKKIRLKEVASQVGFNDAKYFTRVFIKNVGLHPKEFFVQDKN